MLTYSNKLQVKGKKIINRREATQSQHMQLKRSNLANWKEATQGHRSWKRETTIQRKEEEEGGTRIEEDSAIKFGFIVLNCFLFFSLLF